MPQLGWIFFGFTILLPLFLFLLVRFIYIAFQKEKYTQFDWILIIAFLLLLILWIALKDYSM